MRNVFAVIAVLVALAVPARGQETTPSPAPPPSPEEAYVVALRSYVAGDFRGTVESLERVPQLVEQPAAQLLAARAYLRLGRCPDVRPIVATLDVTRLPIEHRTLARRFVARARSRCAATPPPAEQPPEAPGDTRQRGRSGA